MRKLLGLLLGLAISGAAHAQAPSPADVGISKGTPDVFKLKGSDDVWTPFGSVDPSTHVFAPGTNGSIAPGDCLKWGPGITSAGAPCGSGGGGGGGGFDAVYTSHSGLVNNVTTPSGSGTVMQQGFYVPGDGGAAIYDWNATSLCATNQTLSTPTPDGIICVLPLGQSNLTPGRYILRLQNGMLDARVMGFSDDGRDNSPIVDAQIADVVHANPRPAIVFSANPSRMVSNFWFSKPFDVITDGPIRCGDGDTRPYYSTINLMFLPGISGVRFIQGGTAGYPAWSGSYQSTIKGCSIYSQGVTVAGSSGATGSTTISMSQFAPTIYPSILPGGSTFATLPQWAVGDSIVGVNGNTQWYFSGYVYDGTPGTGSSTLNVTTTPTDGDGSIGLQIGQVVIGSGMPHGISIVSDAAHFPTFCTPNCTGAGGIGTYGLSSVLESPPIATEGVPGGAIGSSGSAVGFQANVQSGPPMLPPGTTIAGCSTLTGTQCPYASGATLTMSNGLRASWPFVPYALPGPNSRTGSQMFNVTTSTTGHTYGPFTAGISDGAGGAGTIVNVTAGPGGLNMGQKLLGTDGGAVTGITTTAALTLGQFAGIPVSSCAGVVSGQFVVGFHSGNPIFPPGTSVSDCVAGGVATFGAITAGSSYTNGTYTNVPLTGGSGSGATATVVVSSAHVTAVTLTPGGGGSGYTAGNSLSAASASIGGTGTGFAVAVATVAPQLSINITTGDGFTDELGCHTGFGHSEAGSRVVAVSVSFRCLWIGEPATIPGGGGFLPAGTTVTSWDRNTGSNYANVTLSNPVSTLTTYFSLPVDFGGVVDAAPSGMALTFLNGFPDDVIEGGTGTGNVGTYMLDPARGGHSLAPGSTIYTYDMPGTIYVTGGPRVILPQELLWSDAVPWGATAAETYGTSSSRETVRLSPTTSYGQISALVTHAAGSGKLWALPSGIYSPGTTDVQGDLVYGFAPGINMVCSATNVRPASGCGQSYASRNSFAYDILGRLVVGNNSGGSSTEFEEYDHNFIADIAEFGTVGSNYIGEMLQGADESSNSNIVRQVCGTGTTFYGTYPSGSGGSSTCTNGMVMDYTTTGIGGMWPSPLYDIPWNSLLPMGSTQPGVNCNGAPTSSFKVQNGVITQC